MTARKRSKFVLAAALICLSAWLAFAERGAAQGAKKSTGSKPPVLDTRMDKVIHDAALACDYTWASAAAIKDALSYSKNGQKVLEIQKVFVRQDVTAAKLTYFVAAGPDTVIVAFRGAHNAANTAVFLRGLPTPVIDKTVGWFEVHDGLNSAALGVLKDVQTLLNNVGAKRKYVIVTGHSMGGGVAAYVTFNLMLMNPGLVDAFVTFGSPRFATGNFRTAFDKLAAKTGVKAYSVENARDKKTTDSTVALFHNRIGKSINYTFRYDAHNMDLYYAKAKVDWYHPTKPAINDTYTVAKIDESSSSSSSSSSGSGGSTLRVHATSGAGGKQGSVAIKAGRASGKGALFLRLLDDRGATHRTAGSSLKAPPGLRDAIVVPRNQFGDFVRVEVYRNVSGQLTHVGGFSLEAALCEGHVVTVTPN
jgi:hypothetical protein